MFSIRTIYVKILFNLTVFLSLLLVFLCTFTVLDGIRVKNVQSGKEFQENYDTIKNETKIIRPDDDFNVWLIFTKVINKSPLMYNFKHLINNLLTVSSVPLHFHVFVDNNSQIIADNVFSNSENVSFKYTYYNIHIAANSIMDIVDIMMPHFSSRPGTYYSDSLFYLSLGLYRIAPKEQKTAVMLDCDVFFKEDILNLFNEFKNFNEDTLYGLSPELTPVYRHVLFSYKLKHNTTLGEYRHDKIIQDGLHPKGFQGYNSGVILINLSAIRNSIEYKDRVLTKEFVSELTSKYNFKGHLGDQDFYTLLGYEHPRFFKTLSCGFNRQLCTWWRDHGYKDVFDDYFKCKEKIIVLHGNCNTRIPR